MHGIDRSIPLSFTRVRGTCIPVTLQLVMDVLRVPRIEFPDYPSCERLRIVSRDELMSSFCERPTAWDECLFTPCRPFAKGPNFPLSFTIGDGSHCVTFRSHVLSCLFRSSTPTCMELIIQYLSFSLAFEVRAFLSHCSWLRMCFGSLG